MQWTLSTDAPPYIGADLTDRYSRRCRNIDVCGLRPTGSNSLHAQFWHWYWDRAPPALEVAAVARELRAGRVAMLDGPQALATEAEPIGRALQAALDRAGGVAERVLKSYNQNTITEPI